LIPIRDENRSQTTPHITRMLIIVNVTVFLVLWLSDNLLLKNVPSLTSAVWNFGEIPALILRGQRLYTVFTSMFLHADLIHLGGNMLYLYVFGDNVEDTFGRGRYLLFYLLAGLVASAVHIVALLYTVEVLHSAPSWVLGIPTIGASGAIAGVLGAYVVLYPKARILSLVFLGWMYIVPVPALFFLGFWFVYQLLYGMLALRLPIEVAYWAHIGGFVAGIFFGLFWRGRRRVQVT